MGEFLRKAFDEDLTLFFQFGRELFAHLFGQFGLVFQFGAGRGNAQYGFLAFIPAPGAAQNPCQPLPNVSMVMKEVRTRWNWASLTPGAFLISFLIDGKILKRAALRLSAGCFGKRQMQEKGNMDMDRLAASVSKAETLETQGMTHGSNIACLRVYFNS